MAPFRLLLPALAIVPIEGRAVLDAAAAAVAGYRHLAAWLRDIEGKWATHASKAADGSLRITMRERIDHMRGLSLQLAAPGPKVAYTKAGTLISAAIVEDPRVVVTTRPIGRRSAASTRRAFSAR